MFPLIISCDTTDRLTINVNLNIGTGCFEEKPPRRTLHFSRDIPRQGLQPA